MNHIPAAAAPSLAPPPRHRPVAGAPPRRRAGHLLLAIATLTAGARAARADDGPPGAAAHAPTPLRLTCDYPVLDLPFNAGGGDGDQLAWPSMAQAVGATACVYQLGHKGIQLGIRQLTPRPLWQRLGVATFDLLMPGRPLGTAWMHEEWHRTILSLRGIASHNQVYDLAFFGGVVSVSRVADADLAALKRDHNPDLVRLAAAGIESYHELDTALEKDEFFRGTTVDNRVLLWLDVLGGIAYVGSSLLDQVDDLEREGHRAEHTEHDKDILGHDVTSWVYDLFRPDEAYADRGVHPGGAGVDRYIGSGDLNAEERRYLKLHSGLALLNLVDPFLFGRGAFTRGDVRWNATLRHHLTSFGGAADLHLFLASRTTGNLFLAVHAYHNKLRPFVGLEAQLLDRELGHGLRLSSRAMLWQQPRDQAFRTRAGALGGLASARLATALGHRHHATVELEAKSAGWVAGSPYLDASVAMRLGLELGF